MAENKSEKCSYQSRYGGGWISKGQFLAENMIARYARSQKETLSLKFWEDKAYWGKKFLTQLNHANDLLKTYDIEIIIAALNHPDAKKVYSLGLKSVLVPLMDREKKKQQNRDKIQKEEISDATEVDINQKPRKQFGNKKNIINKLRELD